MTSKWPSTLTLTANCSNQISDCILHVYQKNCFAHALFMHVQICNTHTFAHVYAYLAISLRDRYSFDFLMHKTEQNKHLWKMNYFCAFMRKWKINYFSLMRLGASLPYFHQWQLFSLGIYSHLLRKHNVANAHDCIVIP